VTRIVMTELMDAAAQRELATYPWENRAGFATFVDRPAAAGTAFHRVD
jgi:hypothetical protein